MDQVAIYSLLSAVIVSLISIVAAFPLFMKKKNIKEIFIVFVKFICRSNAIYSFY